MIRRLFLLAVVAAADFSCRVAAITDHDTIKAMHDGAAKRIRV